MAKKRLRHVFSNRELAHVFFHQQEFGIDWGKGAGFISFDGDKIYSYNSVIGIADFKRKVLQFRSASFSNTTSKHQNYVRHAIPGGWKIYHWKVWYSFPSLSGYCNELVLELKAQKEQLHIGYAYIGNDIYDLQLSQLDEFTKTFNCRNLYKPYKKLLLEHKWTDEDKLIYEIKYWAIINNLKGSLESKTKKYLDPILKAEVETLALQKIHEKELAEEERKRIELLTEEERLQKWLNDEYNGNLYHVPIHLRLRNVYSHRNYTGASGTSSTLPSVLYQTVETSHGANVPIEHARLLYKKFRQCIATNTEWETNGHSISIGNYKVSKIYKDKLDGHYKILIGCHLLIDTYIDLFVKNNNLDW